MELMVDISKQYKNFLLKVKLSYAGKALGLLGASGCGKSLTLKCISGIETPDSGKIILNGRTLYDSETGINLPVQQRNVGMLFQNYALFPHMTVKKNIEIGRCHNKTGGRSLEELVTLFRLEGMLGKYPGQLSGGEQQRVALARSIATEPELLMLDEPFYALDAYLKDQVMEELYKYLKEYQGAILMVSHSREEMYRFCDFVTVLYHGHVIESGNREEIFCHPSDIITAQLTGCRNISRAVPINDYMVRALDWRLDLHTDSKVSEDVRYVGIRAHDIRTDQEGSAENRIRVSLLEVSEGPHEYKLLLTNSSDEEHRGSFWWIVSKQEWNREWSNSQSKLIHLPKERILLLKSKVV
jgi:molybdate transport system ATP-binding protein